MSIDQRIDYASRIVGSSISEEEIDYGIEILKKYYDSSDYAKLAYAKALLNKYDNKKNKEKNYQKAELILKDLLKSSSDEYAKLTLAKLYVIEYKDSYKEKFDLGIDYFCELVIASEDYYLEKFIDVLLNHELVDELVDLIEKMEKSESIKTQRLLFKLYFHKKDNIYNPEKAVVLFEKLKDSLDEDVYYRYAKEILEKCNLSYDNEKGEEILDSAISFGSRKGLGLKLKREILHGKYNKVIDYMSNSNILTNYENLYLCKHLIENTNSSDAGNFAIKKVKKIAKDGSSDAKRYLALQHIYGFFIEQDIDRGLNMLKLEYNRGDRLAGLDIAELYSEGTCVVKDYDIALFYLNELDYQLSSYNSYLKGEIYFSATYKNRSPGKARNLFIKAAQNDDYYRFNLAIMMKNSLGFKQNDRGKGLKHIEDFKNSMYADSFSKFGTLAYNLGDCNLSLEFTNMAFENPNTSILTKPYSNLFYLYRKHKETFNLSQENIQNMFKWVGREQNSIDVINLILYQLTSNNETFDWRKSDDRIKKISYPIDSISWWGKIYNTTEIDNEKKESALVIGWLKRHNYINEKVFNKTWQEYFIEAGELSDGCTLEEVDL